MKPYSPKFKILTHTADLKIKGYGKTKKELFLNILQAMATSQKPEIESIKKIKRKIKIKSLDLSSLLVDFLSEILYLSQVNKEVYKEVKFKKFSDNEIEGEVFGQKVKRFGEDIKAVTYHGINVHKREGKPWEATVLFDV